MASIARRPDGTYRPRFRDATGTEHARHFKRKVDAQRWLDEMTAAMVTGQYVDPAAGRVTVREYAERWRTTQVHRPTTAAHVETMLRRHVYPTLGDKRLGSVLPSDIQSLVKQLSLDLAPPTVGVVHRILAGIFKSAVRDRRIVASPCEGTKLPKIHRRRIEPLALEAVEALTEAIPERYRALVTLAAGTGLRCPGGPPRHLAGRRVRLHHRTRRPDPPHGVLRGRLAAGGTACRAQRRDDALPAALLREPAHPARESVKTVQARLGHASAAETLDTYSHLWPDSDDRTRAAVDSVLRRVADSVRTDAAR
jgi:integrase